MKKKHNWRGWRYWIPRFAILTLSIPAAVGVYHMVEPILGAFFGKVAAVAFELSYIGLTMVDLSKKEDKQRAARVSQGAVGVSVVMNVLSAFFVQRPWILDGLPVPSTAPPVGLSWLVAVVVGAPLAILAYLINDLVLHSEDGPSRADLEAEIEFQKAENIAKDLLIGAFKVTDKQYEEEIARLKRAVELSDAAMLASALQSPPAPVGPKEPNYTIKKVVNWLEKQGLGLPDIAKEALKGAADPKEAAKKLKTTAATLQKLAEKG